MKICIVSYDNMKQNTTLVDHFVSLGHEVTPIDFFSFRYHYPNVLYRVYNAFLKVFLRKSIKKIYYGKRIIEQLQKMERQDIVITLKGDFVDAEYLKQIKNYTDRSVSFFNDAVARYPRIKDVYQCFDESFSFEKADCERYGMSFLTNWIFTKKNENIPIKYSVYNISSMDHRCSILDQIGGKLKENDISYKIQVLHSKKNIPCQHIEVIHERLTLDDIDKGISESLALIEVNKDKQLGLSFRVFECMGYHKKLLTTNPDVVHYDFYHPSNIMVINEENMGNIKQFLETPYVNLPSNIYNKYTIDGWFEIILGKK